MAKKNKTVATKENVIQFINAFADSEQKIQDSYRLIELMQEVSGKEPYMYGPSIVGFGNYHYKYASGHEGDAPLIAFSPRKAALTLYVFSGAEEHKHLLDDLGKFKVTKGCIYVKKLSDINEKALVKICKESIKWLEAKYEVK